ncbi:MAG: tetratricopeptide repeat protein [Verrucomicrobia bacterium]|nr:tetratricopeptide repeat protein [Verrucomicrobiota bacterium]
MSVAAVVRIAAGCATFAAIQGASVARAQQLSPFATPTPTAAPGGNNVEIRRALPVGPEPPAASPRAPQPTPAETAAPTALPTPRELPLNFPSPTPAAARAVPPSAPDAEAAATAASPPSSPDAVELAQGSPSRRAAPTRTPPPAAGGGSAGSESNDGEIRLAPGRSGAGGATTTVTPDLLELDAANSLYLKKQFAQAAVGYENYLGQYPNAPATDRQSALWFLAECYRNLKNSKAAQVNYETLLAEFQSGDFVGPASYQLATIYFEQKNYKAAAPLYARSASLAKNNEVLLSSRYYEAACLEKLGRGAETKEIFLEILAVRGNNPYHDTARTALANQYLAEKQSGEALKQFEELARETQHADLKAKALIKAGLLTREIAQASDPKAPATAKLNEHAVELLTRGAAMPEAGPLRAAAQLELLHIYYDTNKYQELVKLYVGAIAAIPDERKPEAMLLAGNAQRQLGRHAEAQTIYDQLMAQFPVAKEASEARYQRIISLYSSNSPIFVQEADNFLLVNGDPVRGDRVKLMKADALFKHENYKAAATAYAALESARNLDAKYRAEALYRLGYCYAQSQQPEKAVAVFTRFITANREHPFVPKALAQRAVAYQQLKNFPAALADFSDLAANYPEAREREIALEQKALLQGQLEDPRGMVATFRLLLKDYPKSDVAGLANFYIGTALYDDKDFNGARAAFDAARMLDAKDYAAKASLRLILCEYQLQNKSRLVSEVDAYRRERYQPDIPAQVLRWLGEAQYRDREYAAAEKNLESAVNSPTNDAPEVWLKLARCRLALRKPEVALENVQKYLELVGASPPARALGLIEQGGAQLALRRFEEAEHSAEEAAQLQPEGLGNLRARLLAGDIDAARGNLDAAAKAYMSISILTDDAEVAPQALRKAAEMFTKLNRPEDATKALDELKARFPQA